MGVGECSVFPAEGDCLFLFGVVLQDDGQAAVGILECAVIDAGYADVGYSYAGGSRFDDLGEMAHGVIVAVSGHGGVVAALYVDGSQADITASGPVGTVLFVEHEVPHDDGFAEAVDGTDADLPHIPHEVVGKGVAVAPESDGDFGKVKPFFGIGLVQAHHLFLVAAVGVIGGSGNVSGGVGIGIQVGRIADLVFTLGLVCIVVVVVVVGDDLGVETCFFECGAEGGFDKVALFLPGHEQGGGVALVQGFVLYGDGVDGDAFSFHGLDVFDKVGGVILVVSGVELPACPRFEGLAILQVVYFHPCRAGPGRGKNLYLRIDGENLFEDG